MQVKVVIGTIAFMLTMIILGYAALREPERMAAFTGAREGRTIETGAKLYISNCASCHGIEAQAEVCEDASGNSIACTGLPLNSYFLVCGDQPERLTQTKFVGSKQQFIERTIAAGRSGTIMPAWSDQYGGAMRNDQVKNVAAYVLNFANDELCAEEPVGPEWAESIEDFLASVEPGDTANGADLYQSYGCAGCHGDVAVDGSAGVGPWLGEIGEVGATRVEGQTAAQYIYDSILAPDLFIAPDCPNGPCAGPPSGMPGGFDTRISDQDMADLLAFLVGE